MDTNSITEFFSKLRRNKAYKILGFISYPLVYFFIKLYIDTYIYPRGVAAILSALLMFGVGLIILFLFILFNIIAFSTINKSTNSESNVFADIGYFLCCALMAFGLIKFLIINPGISNAFNNTKVDFKSDKVLIQKFLDDVNRENKEKYNNSYYNQSSLCVSSRDNFINCFTKYIDGDYSVEYIARDKNYAFDNNPKIITKDKSYYFDCTYRFKNDDLFNYKKATPSHCNVWITYNKGFYKSEHLLTFLTDYFYTESARKHSDFVYEIINK